MKTQEATRTDLVFIIDKSGSMCGLENDTVNGYNDTLAEQRKTPGAVNVTTVLFDTDFETLSDRQPLDKVPCMARAQYNPYGCTALLDAVGSTIKRVNAAQKADEAGRPENTMFVIITDGLENASHKYDFAKVKHMVEKRSKKNGWEFLFLGAGMDAIAAAADLGIGAERAATYVHDAEGTETVYGAVRQAVACCRSSMPMDGWKDRVEADYAARG